MAEYIVGTGTIVPDTAEVRAAVEAEWKAALGDDLVVTPDTPQGVMITAEVEARMAVLRNNAALANQINPNLSGGAYLDAVCALTGLARNAAGRSFVGGVVVAGVPDTIIPAGSIAKTTAGDLFATASAVTIPAGGSTTVGFIAVNTGPVPALAGELVRIVSDVLGWESVTNPYAAVLGRNEQADEALRAKRRRTLALQGVSMSEAITSALYDVEGVTSLQYRENVTAATATIDGISLTAHSVWACVQGGTDSAVARALLANKSVGAGWNGAITVSVPDHFSGQVYPVKFDRPTEVPIKVRVTVTVRPGATQVDAQTAVREAVMAWVELAEDGLPGLRVGGNVSPFEVAASVNSREPTLYVGKVELATIADDTFSTAEIEVELSQIPTLDAGNITVVVA